MDEIGMDDDNGDDVHMLAPHDVHMQPHGDGLLCETILQVFLEYGYSPTSNADVSQMGRLKSVCKLFLRTVNTQLCMESWLEPLSLEVDMSNLRINDSLAQSQYADLFDRIRVARIVPEIQQRALSAMHTHMTDAVVQRMHYSADNATAAVTAQRCGIIANVMRYHCCDTVIVGFGAGILRRLLYHHTVHAASIPLIAAVLVDAVQRFPSDRTLQENAITALSLFIENRPLSGKPLAAKMCCMADGDIVAHVFAGMRLLRDEYNFQQVGLNLIMALTASPEWRRGTRPAARGTKKQLVDAVWLQGVESRLLQVMQQQESDISRSVGCQALANMAVNNLREMQNIKTLRVHIVSFMQLFASGRGLHAMAMAPATALCVKTFSYDARGAHVQNQNFFTDCGVVPMMLSGLQAYADGLVHWPMKSAASVIQGLDAVCRGNYAGTARFINANGVDILILGAYMHQMATAAPANYRSEAWASTFAMLYHILTLRVRTRPNEDTGEPANASHKKTRTSTGSTEASSAGTAATAAIAVDTPGGVGVHVVGDHQPGSSTDTFSMPFLSLISRRFANTNNVRHIKKTTFCITELALLCITDKVDTTRPLPLRATDAVVQQCLELLCVCMQKPAGLHQMRSHGVPTILTLKTQNAEKTRSCFQTDVLCMKVLAIAVARSHQLVLSDALLSVAARTPGMLDGMQVKVPAKEARNPVYINGAHIAKQFVDTFRKGLLRMQLKECMHNMLANASDIDEKDKNEIKRQTFVPAKQSEVPLELRSTDAAQVRPPCLSPNPRFSTSTFPRTSCCISATDMQCLYSFSSARCTWRPSTKSRGRCVSVL